MELVVDVGNSRIKLAVFDADDLVKLVHCGAEVTAADLSVLGTYDISSILISTVRNDASTQLSFWSELAPSKVFNTSTALPVTNGYETPETLGKDRIAAIVGARGHFPDGPLLSIDIGTCITYDVLTNEDVYLGGSISPGIELRYKAMHTFTGALPLVEDRAHDGLYGTSTHSSLSSGVLNGICLEIEGFISAYEAQFPGIQVVLTGGDADHFANRLKKKIFADPNLVLKGLQRILKFNEA